MTPSCARCVAEAKAATTHSGGGGASAKEAGAAVPAEPRGQPQAQEGRASLPSTPLQSMRSPPLHPSTLAHLAGGPPSYAAAVDSGVDIGSGSPLLRRRRSSSTGSGSGSSPAAGGLPPNVSLLSPLAAMRSIPTAAYNGERAPSSLRKRTYSFSSTSPHVSPSLSAQPAPAASSDGPSFGSLASPPLHPPRRLAYPSSHAPSAAQEATRDAEATAMHALSATIAAPAAHHASRFLAPGGTLSSHAYSSSATGAIRPSPSPPPAPAVALLALTGSGCYPGDPLPLSSQEVLLEEEEVDEGPESVIEEAGEQRQWRGLRNVWTQVSLLLSLAVRLVSTLGMTTKWMRMLGRLICFSVALAPAWVIIGRTYFGAKFIKRGVRYGLNARNFLDIYLPHELEGGDDDGEQGKQQQQRQGGEGDKDEEQLCEQHRAEAEAERSAAQESHRSILRSLPIPELDSILRTIAGGGGVHATVDANAALELRRTPSEGAGGGDTKEGGTGKGGKLHAAKFAADMANNAQQPAPTPSFSVHHVPSGSNGVRTPTPSTSSPAFSFSSVSTSAPPRKPLAPVVIFLTGGAWSIGYKAWGALLGLGLSAHGVLVASVDYRNFPQGDISDMLLDVQTALTFVFRHIESFGGDPSRVFLAGQSAGAHLGALAVLNNVEQLLAGKRTSWTAHRLRGFIGISGPYDLPDIKEHLHERGLPLMVFLRMMRSRTDEDLARYSPAKLAAQPWLLAHMRGGNKSLGARDRLLPPFLLIHGKGDKTVHWQGTDAFAQVLHAAQVPVRCRFYKGYSHTDPIIEGPLTGHDHLCHDVLSFITEQCEAHAQHQRDLQQQVAVHQQRVRSMSSASSSSSCSSPAAMGTHRTIAHPTLATSATGLSLAMHGGAPPSSSPSSVSPPGSTCNSISPPAPSARHRDSDRENATHPRRNQREGRSSRKTDSSSAMRELNEHSSYEQKHKLPEEEEGLPLLPSPPPPGPRSLRSSPTPAPAPSPSLFKSLLYSVASGLSFLPSLLVPSSERLRRQPSHLPSPFHLIDDVNEASESEWESESEEEDAFDARAGAQLEVEASDGEGKGVSPSPSPPPSTPSFRDLFRPTPASHPHHRHRSWFPIRVIPRTWRVCMWLLPGTVSRAVGRVLGPLGRVLRLSSPPPPPASARSPVRHRPAAPVDAADSDGAQGVASLSSPDAASSPSANGRRGPKSSPRPSPRRRRPRYVYPLQAAAKLPRKPPQPLIPRVLIRMARYINPF